MKLFKIFFSKIYDEAKKKKMCVYGHPTYPNFC